MRAIWLSALLLLGLVACDAGPSAVLPDGAGKAPSEQVQTTKAPAWAQADKQASGKDIEQASMPVVDAAPVSGEALPIAATRAKVTETG